MKKLRVWDGGNANSSNALFNEIKKYGARFIKSVNAGPFNAACPCGYLLVFDLSAVSEDDRRYLLQWRDFTRVQATMFY